MRPIPEVTDVDVVFPARPPLPAEAEIPREFWRDSHPMAEIASSLFFRGGRLADFGLKARDGVDVTKAIRVLQCCLGSFDPQHEHKIAGVAFLLSEWFEQGEVPKPEPRQSHKAAARAARKGRR